MAFGTSVLLSNGPQASQTTWTLAASGFVNPSYLGGDFASTGLYTSDGFQIEQGTSLIVAFEGTYGAVTLFHEQTMDLAGATGWFPVVGYALDNSSSGGGVSTTGVAYAFPTPGVRHRIRVTALASGTLVARASLSSDVAVVASASGGGAISVITGNRTPKGYQQIVGMVAAATLTVPAGSKIALITCEGQAVRWRDDGVAPTATVGMELQIGQVLMYDGTLSAIQFIQEAATGTLNVSYYA